MRFLSLSIAAFATIVLAEDSVNIEITRAVDCERKSQKGDRIQVHYRGTLQDGGTQFDASYDRGQPLEFVVGQGQVIRGWDENLLDMCIGEKRILTIPPSFGYGDRGVGPIPAGSTLIFETELMGIAGVPKPETIVELFATPPSSEAPEETEASEATEGIKEGIKEAIKTKLADAAEAVKVVVADTDQDGQEHNEL